jgi:predicted acylesterase/phospholipase RssA
MALRIQLAVQGGGAKLCGLLAALDGVQRLEREGVIEVTRLAGTSAGAIAAALYAAQIDFAMIRQRIRDNREKLKKMLPPPSAVRFVIGAGRPMVDLDPVKMLLGQIFQDSGVSCFGDLKKKKKSLIVVTSDVTNCSSRTFEKDDDFVVNSIVDSCAIPFYFRGPGRKNDNMLLVDGGICENLPVEYLRSFEAEDGMVVGVTFKPGRPGVTPTSLLAFSKALLETAMNNSVRRAQFQLGEERLLSLNSDIDTFDFDRALYEGMESRYDLILRQAEDFFRGMSDAKSRTRLKVVVEPGPESEQSATTLQRVADLYTAQHAHVKMHYTEARMIVRIGALSIVTESGSSRPDHLSYRLKFEAASEPLACARIALAEGPGAEFLGTVRKEVYDKDGNMLRTIDLLAREKTKPDQRWYLLFFDPVIQPGNESAPFTLEYGHQVRDLMAPLAEDGVDSILFHTSRAEGNTDRVLLIALIPDTHPHVGIRPSALTTGPVKGREMTDKELRVLDLTTEADHYARGWIGENVGPGEVFATEIYQPNFKRQ